MRFSYITVVRIDSPERSRNLSLVLEWLVSLPEMEIILIEQDATPRLDARQLPDKVGYFYQQETGRFNKSRAMNAGYKIARGKVLVFGDADMVMPINKLMVACVGCEKTFAAINPYVNVVDLSPALSETFNPVELPPDDTPSVSGPNRFGAGEFLCFAGGIFVIRKAFFEQLGGMDESFCGWGGEDDAMSIKINRTTRDHAVAQSGTAFHLWHPRCARGDTEINVRLLEHYRVLDDNAFRTMCQNHRRSLAG